jgi:Endonuclease/Exonuclease/phosphatase family
MISFLFWNLNKLPLQRRVARMASTYEVDVLMLAECAVDPADVLAEINAACAKPYRLPRSYGTKIRIFTRLPAGALVDEFTDPLGGLTIRKLRVGKSPSLLLAVVHFPSRVHWDRDDQTLEAMVLADDIARAEDQSGHRRTILVGDLNMNPFDPGVAGSTALHAVMTRDVARREEREVRGRPYRLFYNPMWGCYGDQTHGPPGSYYLRASKPLNYYWNIYDQVLVRPEIMDRLKTLRILDNDGRDSLLTQHGLPGGAEGSDHLPIFFQLDL